MFANESFCNTHHYLGPQEGHERGLKQTTSLLHGQCRMNEVALHFPTKSLVHGLLCVWFNSSEAPCILCTIEPLRTHTCRSLIVQMVKPLNIINDGTPNGQLTGDNELWAQTSILREVCILGHYI